MADVIGTSTSEAGVFVGRPQAIPPQIRRAEGSAWDRLRNRRGEGEKTYFRCDRYFTVGHEWYASTRENKNLGPFLHHTDAKIALARYVAYQHVKTRKGIAKIFSRDESEVTPFEHLVREIVECWEQRHLRSGNSAYVWIMQRIEAIEKAPRHSEVELKALKRMLAELE